MFFYEKSTAYPIRIQQTDPNTAKIILSQYGGPNGELGASLRYLSQRFSMPYPELRATLNDIGTEELGHLEMVGTIVRQLVRNLTPEQIREYGFEGYFLNHGTGIYPSDTAGVPFDAVSLASSGDLLADLHEDMAAEQKARAVYDNILRLVDDPDVRDPIRFLREREIVHYQRFGECVRIALDRLGCRNFYAVNPEFGQ